ncbi:hydantoinase B/oxoprolinase family protein [Jannaschia sp. 2305UL9-9]|uniref:hydantoinase B/oxoprolinase family protein n=1 Tax=Jannaschia sp. 2305UL9-9 TaxID=3121638 RepID=UPI003527CEAE
MSVADVALQVIWTRLISVVEEQAQALVRTAFSTSVREAGDLSAGVYDAEGRMLAQAVTGTPGHVNAMADAVAHFIEAIGLDTMAEGDVYLTNDPWLGTGHLHDITMVTPSFLDGRLVGYFACTAHIVDIGGRGFGADAASVYEEGLRLPIMRFADRGTVDPALIRIVRANVREPDQLVGDLYALATCNEIGHRRLVETMREFALSDLAQVSDFILGASRRATLERIAALPRMTAMGEMTVDGFATPITLRATVTVHEDRIVTDFDGTSAVDPKGINCPLVYTKAYACYALKVTIAPDIPNNHASLAPFEVTAPEGTIVNAVHPAPVALRHIVGHFVPDTVFDAFDKIVPDLVPAEGAGCLCNFQVSVRPTGAGGRRAEVLTFNSGGSGARPTADGLNATAFPSGVMTMPVEATEHAGPVVIWRKELREGSGGAGERRGGLGQHMEVGTLPGHEFDLQAMFDRRDHPARGRRGGASGAATLIGRSDGAAMQVKGKQHVPEGARVVMAFPGGGGYGDPAARDGDAVARDLARGYIDAATARDVYGMPQDRVDAVLAAARKGTDI